MFSIELSAGKKNVIDMSEMKPYEIGVLTHPGFEGTIVMRTASETKFEVMKLSGDIGVDECWTNRDSGHKVKLLPKGTKIILTIV
ncbi:MAG: hypothetical protein ACOC1K_05990 [Nanoarchaeota archaeon]